MQVIRGPSKGFVAIVGDRTALVRLAITILKAACSRCKERAIVIDNLFVAPSPARDFMIQVEEAPSGHEQNSKPHSTIKLVSSVLFKGK